MDCGLPYGLSLRDEKSMGPLQDQQNYIERIGHIQFLFFFFSREVNVLKKKTTIEEQRKIHQESISYTRINK